MLADTGSKHNVAERKDTNDIVEKYWVFQTTLLYYSLNHFSKSLLPFWPIVLQQDDHVTE